MIEREPANSILWGLLIGISYGLLFGYLSTFSWLIAVPAVFMAVTSVGEGIKLIRKMGPSLPRFWFASLLGALIADLLIILLPLLIVTFQSDLDGTVLEKMQVSWKFYLLSLNSIGSNLIITITAGIGMLGFVGIYRRL